MGKIQLDEEQFDKSNKKDNIVDLKLITGGKGPGSGNWLLDLDVGSMFLVKDKRDPNNPLLGEFMLVAKDPSVEGDVVFLAGPDIPGGRKPFDPHAFVARYRKYRTVGLYEQKEQETKEVPNEQGDRAPGDGDGKA